MPSASTLISNIDSSPLLVYSSWVLGPPTQHTNTMATTNASKTQDLSANTEAPKAGNINTASTKPSYNKATEMTITKTTTATNAMAKRSFSAFSVFQKPEMISGIKGLVTVQPLNKGREAGWFIDNDAMDTCKWTASEEDFEKDSVIFNYTHKFGMGSNRTEKTGVLITKPRIQVVMKSQLLVEEKSGMNRILGTYQDLAAEYQADKEKDYSQRQYNTRVKYLIFLLKADNTPAHSNPIVLTLKNLNSVDMDRKYKQFIDLMQRTLSTAFGEDHPLIRNGQFPAICSFNVELGFEEAGAANNEVVAIRGFEAPDYSTVEAAQESLVALTIPDTMWEQTWKLQSSSAMQNYIMMHSQSDAEKLGGRYGVAPGVQLMPEGVKKALPGRDAYGADESL